MVALIEAMIPRVSSQSTKPQIISVVSVQNGHASGVGPQGTIKLITVKNLPLAPGDRVVGIPITPVEVYVIGRI